MHNYTFVFTYKTGCTDAQRYTKILSNGIYYTVHSTVAMQIN